jgi:hypothetical protein
VQPSNLFVGPVYCFDVTGSVTRPDAVNTSDYFQSSQWKDPDEMCREASKDDICKWTCGSVGQSLEASSRMVR